MGFGVALKWITFVLLIFLGKCPTKTIKKGPVKTQIGFEMIWWVEPDGILGSARDRSLFMSYYCWAALMSGSSTPALCSKFHFIIQKQMTPLRLRATRGRSNLTHEVDLDVKWIGGIHWKWLWFQNGGSKMSNSKIFFKLTTTKYHANSNRAIKDKKDVRQLPILTLSESKLPKVHAQRCPKVP